VVHCQLEIVVCIICTTLWINIVDPTCPYFKVYYVGNDGFGAKVLQTVAVPDANRDREFSVQPLSSNQFGMLIDNSLFLMALHKTWIED